MLFPEIKSKAKSEYEELTYFDSPIGYKMSDFWKWSMSELISNAARGKFAEFIVGTSIGYNFSNVRDDWGPYDVETDKGIKIEVKSSAYIQSWNQNELSRITFSIKETSYWDSATKTNTEKERRADVYVFCVLKHKEQETLDILKLEQWEFYVVETSVLNKHCKNQKSISLSHIQKLTDAISYPQLRNKILDINNKIY